MKGLVWIGVMLVAAGTACSADKELRRGGEEGLTAHHNPYTLHRSIAHTLLRTNQAERAVPHIRVLLNSKPDDPEPHYLMAKALLGMKIFPGAAKELDTALEKDKKYAAAYALRGVLLDTLGKHRKAEKEHRKAVKISPKDVGYLNNLGFCLYLQGRYSEATDTYRKALQYSPASPRIHNNLAFSLARSGNSDLALKHFQMAGGEARAHNNMGIALELSGKLDDAYGHYLKAVVSNQKLAAAQENLARVCRKLGRPVPDVLPLNHGPAAATQPEGARN